MKKENRHKDFQEFLLERLKNEDVAKEYLNEALKDVDQGVFFLALKNVIEAQNRVKTDIAQQSKISRQHLHRILSKKGNPRWSNLNSIFNNLGLHIQLEKNRTK